MDRKIRVCIVIEGSYPYITGGVSSWVHQLIGALPDFEFILYSISPKEDQEMHYKVPDNVVGFKDIVISQQATGKRKTWRRDKILAEVEKLHTHFKTNSFPDFSKFVDLLPKNYYLYNDSIDSPEGWNLVTYKNQLNNPAYPFADYFWSWKSSHDMMFTVIGADPPDADMYHAISTGYAGLAAVIAKIKTGKPLILTEHGLYHKEREIEIKRANFVKGYQRDMWTKIYNQMSRLTYHYSDLIISLFEHNRRLQIELGAPEERCQVIPNGIDIEFFAGAGREKRKGFHIGFVGRVVPIKDVKCFILSCKIISEIIPEAEFHCIGPTDEDEPYYEDCVNLVESFRLEKCFHFTGRQDVRSYYAFIDVLMLTSVREAQPLVILEAYAAGVPVVSTKVGNVPEMLDYDDRFLAASKDSEKLAQCIKYIYDHPEEMKEIIRRNKEKVYRFYDRKQLHHTYGELYTSFAGKDR